MTQAALPILRTPRLELRPLQDDDADALTKGVGNFDVSKWLSVVPYPYDKDDARAFLSKVAAQDKPFWAICNAHGLQGVVSLDDELAYWLARDVWGKGYGFEAAHAAVSYWFSDVKSDTLMSGYFDGNDRSGALLRALGFRLKERITRYAKSFQQEVVSNQMTLTRKAWEARQDFTLYTPRLTLRPMMKKDAPAYAALGVAEVTRNLAMLKTHMSIEDALSDLQSYQWDGFAGFLLGIEFQGLLIGAVRFGGTPTTIGYFIGPEFWGQGIVTEALSAFLPAVFDRFPVNTLYADQFEDNPASGAILAKFGFQEHRREMYKSNARLEPAPAITYALSRDSLRVPV